MGLWEGVKFLGTQAIVNNPASVAIRWIKTGDPRTVEDQRRWQTAKGIALKLAQVVEKITLDQQAFIYALHTGDDAIKTKGDKNQR